MKSSTRVAAVLVGAMLAISLAGCAADPPAAPEATTSVPAATATSTASGAQPTSDPPSVVDAEHNDADVTFVQMMTIHHQGALEMSELAAQQTASSEVKEVAATIEGAQLPEIQLMQSWLSAWGEPVEPGGHAGMDHGGMDMNGKSQEQVMAELQEGTGTEFDNQFLSSMIAHHEGAVVMAEEELRDGNNPQALELAQRIIDAQQIEIHQMQELLQNL